MLLAVGHEELVLNALDQRLEKFGVRLAGPIAQGRLDQSIGFLDFVVQLGYDGLELLVLAPFPLQAEFEVVVGLEEDVAPVLLTGERDALAKLGIVHGALDFSEGGLADEPEWAGSYLGMGEYSCVERLERTLELLGLEAMLGLLSS